MTQKGGKDTRQQGDTQRLREVEAIAEDDKHSDRRDQCNTNYTKALAYHCLSAALNSHYLGKQKVRQARRKQRGENHNGQNAEPIQLIAESGDVNSKNVKTRD